LRLKFIITSILVAILFSGCMGKRGDIAPGYKTLTTSGYSGSRGGASVGRVYNAKLSMSGDLSFLDRRYFRRTFVTKLEDRGININYNSLNEIDIKITKSVLDDRSSGGASYQNCSAFKLDRKVVGTVEYIIHGKNTYADSINYKFLVKSSSCISYDDAERKAKLLLIKKLARITAARVAKHKNILNTPSSSCAVR